MKNFSDLTYAEIEVIDDKAAIAAIEKTIIDELKTGSTRDLLNNGWADPLRAQVGDVWIFFKPEIPTDVVDALFDGIEGRSEMTDAEVDKAHWEAFECEVHARIEQGLGRYIWQEITDKAAYREAA